MLTTLRFLSTSNLLIMPQEVRAILEYVFVPHNQRRRLDPGLCARFHTQALSAVEVIAKVGSIEARGFCSSPLAALRGDAPRLVAGEEVR